MVFLYIMIINGITIDIKESSSTSSFYGRFWPTIFKSSYFLLRSENLKTAAQIFIYTHHSTTIIELSAVIRGREYRDQLPLIEKLISVFYNLMGSTNQI